MSSSQGPKKLRVYEVARELGMSSEAVLQIVRRLGVEVKNHMSTLLPETVQTVQSEIGKEKTAVKEELHRQHEQEVQRAREERARAASAAATLRPGAPTGYPAGTAPHAGPAAPAAPPGAHAAAGARPVGAVAPGRPSGPGRPQPHGFR
ncbi:MAG TPA: translation initiation factor IF-2 N-terminal domain-containing protein, partial [Terriglobales bacterium]|nr:translation initiation factor IF-2 N-terminal domain-containing protein [Terriglobales bacterium]